ncbi:MAG TPA: ComEC/Rec2 family competence protein [Patescibacteria group bacterium]|nr:ComEC/Rec2 family competence protein [Patescibacteria group bacterium]
MVLWWAAFIASGIIFPPDVRSIALVSACIILYMFFVPVLWRIPDTPAAPPLSSAWNTAVRVTLIVFTVFPLWTCAGLERERYEQNGERRGGGTVHLAASERTGSPARHSGDGRSSKNGSAGNASYVAKLRAHLVRDLSHPRLTPLSSSMMGALLLARRSDLPRIIRDAYEYLGIAHFLALSGLHLGIIAVPIAYFLSLMRLRRFHRSCLLVAILFLYVAVAGFPPSLVRALSLTAAVLLYRALSIKTTLMRPLVLGGIAVACINAGTVMRAGFQLSFAAVCGIGLIGMPLVDVVGSRLPRRRLYMVARAVLFSVLVTVSIQLFTLPLVLLLFKRASLLAPAMNILMMIPVSIFLYTGCVFLLVPVGQLRNVLAIPLDLVSRILRDLPAVFSHRPHPALYYGDIEPLFYSAGIILLALGLAKRQRRRVIPLCTATLCIIASVTAGNGFHRPRQTAIAGGEINHGCLLVDCRPYILYLESDMSWYDGHETVRNLWSHGIRSIGTIVIGEDGGKGRGGIRHILERVVVRQIVCSPYLGQTRGDIVRAAEALDIPIRTVSRGDTVVCGECTIEILEPRYPLRGGEVIARRGTVLRCRLMPGTGQECGLRGPIVLPRRAGDGRVPERR